MVHDFTVSQYFNTYGCPHVCRQSANSCSFRLWNCDTVSRFTTPRWVWMRSKSFPAAKLLQTRGRVELAEQDPGKPGKAVFPHHAYSLSLPTDLALRTASLCLLCSARRHPGLDLKNRGHGREMSLAPAKLSLLPPNRNCILSFCLTTPAMPTTHPQDYNKKQRSLPLLQPSFPSV